MERLVIISAIILIASSCGRQTPTIDYKNKNTGDSLKMETLVKDTTKTLVAELPVFFDSTGFLIHPIGFVNLNTRRSRNFESGSFSGSSSSEYELYVSGSRNDYHGEMTNLVFENIRTGEQRLLTNKVISIRSFVYLKPVFKRVRRQYILYTLADNDSNNDKAINSSDIESLYISSVDGTGLRKLTRDRQEYSGGKLYTKALRYYFSTIEDVNHDGFVNKKDKIHYYYIDFSKEKPEVIEYYPLKLVVK
jgi:hypothetical protein